MGDSPGTTSQKNPFQGLSFVSPPCGDVFPPFMATLSLPGLIIGLPIWLFSNIVIPNTPLVSDHAPFPHENHPHVNPSPSSSNVESVSLSSSSPVENSDVSKRAGKKKLKRKDTKKFKRKDMKKKTKQKVTTPTSDHHVGSPPDTGHHPGSIDVPVSSMHNPKLPCRIRKGDHILKDFPGLSLVSEVWSKQHV